LLSREKDGNGEVTEPGREIRSDQFLHHQTAEILDSRDDDELAEAVTKDSVAYRYYIHHQRKINGVPISGMSPIPIVCVIAKDQIETGQYEVVPEPAFDDSNMEPELFDQKMFWIKIKSSDHEDCVKYHCDAKIGDVSTLYLNIYTSMAVDHSWNEKFT
jgi:hypothetical protein